VFVQFFYTLKESGIPVSPTSFLTLHRAMSLNLTETLDDFYYAARTILVKSERYFDIFDQVFAHHFHGVELPDFSSEEMDNYIKDLLSQWLKEPKSLAQAMGISEDQLNKMSPEELLNYFKERLEDQKEEHHGGSRWIGTGGTSPVGHSGYHPGGMRVNGISRNQSAVKVAMDRRYKDYSLDGPLTKTMMREALKRLRVMKPEGARDNLNIDKTIYQTIQKGGEIELVFDRSLKDRLKVVLLIDNGGYSMDPYIETVQSLFYHARSIFREVQTLYFHNTIYGTLWQDPQRFKKPVTINDLLRKDPETRLFFIGDASMAPYELMAMDGSIYWNERSGMPSIEQLRELADRFKHTVWLNPVPARRWHYTHTISLIAQVFPMYELSIDGLEKAVSRQMTG
jgi:uncharacterized protein